MCRLFLGNKASILAYNKRFGLLNLLQHLEKECGGHGNGYALLKAGKLAGSGKGLKLDSKTIADILLSSSYEYAVYHTRVVSVGSLSDEQCHPFISESTNSALAMNGTIGHLRDIASILNQSDTQVISFLTSNMSIGDCITTLQQLRAVFVGFQQGIPYVVKTSGDLEQYGSSYLYASSFPLEVYEEARKLHNGFTLAGHKVLSAGKPETKKTYTFTSYGSASYSYNYQSRFDDDYATDYFSESYDASILKEAVSTPEITGIRGLTVDEAYELGYEYGYEDGRISMEEDVLTGNYKII